MRSALAGIGAALQAPLVLRGRRLRRLLQPPSRVGRPSGRAPDEALRWARGVVARLARIPGSPWRSTCLYRSAAECLVLRRYGIPAVLRIGVRNEDVGGIEAHAWVERPGGSVDGTAACPGAEGYAPLALRRGA